MESSTLKEHGEEKVRGVLHPKRKSKRRKVRSLPSLNFIFFYVFFSFLLLEKKKMIAMAIIFFFFFFVSARSEEGDNTSVLSPFFFPFVFCYEVFPSFCLKQKRQR